MQLYNTLSRELETVATKKNEPVKLYTCGPTVYNYAHIGNLRNAIFNDVLRRSLKLAGHEVKHVMNVTDVGHLVSDADEGHDKLESGAEREGKTVWEVAQFYTDRYLADIAELDIWPADQLERATDHIPAQIKLVETLMKKGYAYQTKQAIYFDVTRSADYGKLSGQSLEDKLTAVREDVVSDPEKRSPHDFAVWFFTVGRFADHTMRWDSPWGEGFPGWHIECSAIIHATLGEPIDIHTGGIDHIGTHHTNEIAQSEAAYGKPLAKIWLHNEFLLVAGQKMSKSLENLFTIDDIKTHGFDPISYRLLVMQAHYRSELNFTWDSLRSAQLFLFRLQAFADRKYQLAPEGESIDEVTKQLQTRVQECLSNDLDTAQALAALSQAIDQLDQLTLGENQQAAFQKLLDWLDTVFGLRLASRPDITPEVRSLIDRRQAARADSNFNLADQLRQELATAGILTDDRPEGPRWRRLG